MRFKPYYLYLAGGTIALAIVAYEFVVYFAAITLTEMFLSALPVFIFYYLAFRSYHETEDHDLM